MVFSFTTHHSPLASASSPSARPTSGGRIDRLLEEAAHVAHALLQERHALVHPLRTRLAEEVVIEELVHVDGPVLHVVAVAEAVRFTVVREHVGFLAEAAHRGVELDSLIPR